MTDILVTETFTGQLGSIRQTAIFAWHAHWTRANTLDHRLFWMSAAPPLFALLPAGALAVSSLVAPKRSGWTVLIGAAISAIGGIISSQYCVFLRSEGDRFADAANRWAAVYQKTTELRNAAANTMPPMSPADFRTSADAIRASYLSLKEDREIPRVDDAADKISTAALDAWWFDSEQKTAELLGGAPWHASEH